MTNIEAIYLDSMPLIHSQVGYGQLGLHGQLGYENKQVLVRGQNYKHAISSHAPARLLWDLSGRYARFVCQVAICDDVAAGISHADFAVLADGKKVGIASSVAAGEPPRSLEANVAGAKQLELVVGTTRFECCHSVWLDPQLDGVAEVSEDRSFIDCLGRASVHLPTPPPQAQRCIATVASAGYAALLEDMLGSLYANGGCHDALLVVLLLGDDPQCQRVAAKFGATVIYAQPRTKLGVNVKSLLYSIACIVDAEQFLCLDADMLILKDLNPVFGAIDACPANSILACREGNGFGYKNLEHALTSTYSGRGSDLTRLLGATNGEGSYSFVVNDGLFAGSRLALAGLDGAIRAMLGAAQWVDEVRIGYRNQFIFNLALAKLNCGVELDASYNLQLHVQDADVRWEDGRMQAFWQGRPVRALHFSGAGRRKYPEWRGLFAGTTKPLLGAGGGDGYAGFLTALRSWLGRYGGEALAWTFFGTPDGESAVVHDPSTLPVLACLHFLIRANGCVQVLETGTARGVSTACLASAVMHRQGGRVVTMDVAPQPERIDLWAALPPEMRQCIEQRTVDSLEGMRSAIAAGESYQAVLLDSLHTGEHVWEEFQLATQLVCAGGLILIHDAQLSTGTVPAALEKIDAAGYGVVRLWTAEAGIPEDEKLGLAVIENYRRRPAEIPDGDDAEANHE